MSRYELYCVVDKYQRKQIRKLPLLLLKEKWKGVLRNAKAKQNRI